MFTYGSVVYCCLNFLYVLSLLPQASGPLTAMSLFSFVAIFAHKNREVVYQHCAEQLVSINHGSGRSAHAQCWIKKL